tara:strand:- start:862 stop:1206 length:345 start_codon:yes stop_codon:yes gene_type:complete
LTVSSLLSEENTIYRTAVFKIPDTADFLWRSMDDAHVIYDARSGHSQVLNDFAREILALIEDEPRDLEGLFKELEHILEISLEADLKEQVLTTLVAFDKMGLIEPAVLQEEGKP